MREIDKARFVLTLCNKCLGCNRLEDENFRGDNNCRNFHKGVSDDDKKGLYRQRDKVYKLEGLK